VLGIFGSIVAMVLWVGGTLVTFLLIHTFWPPTHRRSHNEIVGWQMSVIGTTYAVILGFMLYNVWDNFRTADLNADQEANALVSLYRLADGLPDSSRKEVQAAARRYATIVVQEEWPDMSRRAFSPAGAAVTQELWETIVKVGREPSSQSATFMQVVAQLATMTEHRRVRHLESRSNLPVILWIVLLSGGVITIVSSCLLSSESFRLHFVLILCLSLILGITLLAIAEVDRPFQGPVRVEPDGFELALQTFSKSTQ
jgi:Protein of unknown function (DUF4239)